MFEAEGQIAGLEAGALAPAQYRVGQVGRHHPGHGLGQCGMVLGLAVVQHLDFEAVARPVETGGGGGHADGERAFIADRKLHQHARQLGLFERGLGNAARALEVADQRQRAQLRRQERQQNQHAGQDKLQEQGQADHDGAFGPPLSDLYRQGGGLYGHAVQAGLRPRGPTGWNLGECEGRR